MKKYVLLFLVGGLLLSSCRKQKNFFTVTWLNDNGDVLEVDEKVEENTMPHYDGKTPSKESDEKYDYSFLSWDKMLTKVTSNVTYTATYKTIEKGLAITPNYVSGFYNSGFDLMFDVPDGYEAYYTTDNTDPTEQSIKYDGPIRIEDVSSKYNFYSLMPNISSLDVYYPTELVDKCSIIKVVAFNKINKTYSHPLCLNYFVGYQNKSGYLNMPVISLDINDEDLYDYEKGIYVTGKIYDESPHEGYPETYPANYHQKGKEWERKAYFKYFDSAKTMELEQNIGVRIHGGWSRAFNQKSFNLYARKEYSDTSTFGYQFFDDINAHSLMLRSGGYRDTALTKVRDSLDQDFSVNEKFDIQRSMPVIVFLNGEYWGIYNLQERFSDNYVSEHHDVSKKNVLIIKNDEIDEGEESDYHYYEELIDFFQSTDLSVNANYELAKDYIDMEEFASYMSTQLYVGNIDWPGNNVRMWKDIKNDSQWHFMMYDTDDSSGILSYKCGYDIDPFLKSSHWKSGPLESDCVLGLMLSKLITNASFKALFRSTFIRIGQEVFTSTKVNSYLNNKQALLAEPMVKNYKRFVNNSYNEDYFDNQIEIIRNFFNHRYDYAISFLNEHIPAE